MNEVAARNGGGRLYCESCRSRRIVAFNVFCKNFSYWSQLERAFFGCIKAVGMAVTGGLKREASMHAQGTLCALSRGIVELDQIERGTIGMHVTGRPR